MTQLAERIEALERGVARVADQAPELPQPEVVLLRMLLMTGQVVADQFERTLKPHGLSESEFRTLIVLLSSPQGRAHPGELCQFATQKPTNMTRITDGLVRRGLATRTPSDSDRRRIVLQLTPVGRRFARKLLPLLFPHARALFAGFSAAEKRALHRALCKLLLRVDALASTDATKA
ncbi:MAG TPA: MarR family transcriptional regulator [Rhodanobacteraceae bacterium]|nr:MarR family transcriptional regulator [Rhodanobacteraceae bacterium]